LAPVGAAIAGTGAVTGAATSPTFEDDAALAPISALLGKGRIRIQRRAAKAAEEQAAVEANLRSKVNKIINSFATGGG
jgi:hypothetical protein